jgi:hypothetical protein
MMVLETETCSLIWVLDNKRDALDWIILYWLNLLTLWYKHSHAFSINYVRYGESRILLKSVMSRPTVNCVCVCVCVYEEVQLKSKLRHTGAWQPLRLCYHPAVFFLHLCFAALSFLHGTIWRAFTKIFLYFTKNCMPEIAQAVECFGILLQVTNLAIREKLRRY